MSWRRLLLALNNFSFSMQDNMTLARTFFLLLFSVTLTIPTVSLAEDLYISDKLFVPVRKGQGNQFSILHRGLPSGTRVTLVERDTNWSKITTDEGITGWVRNQYLLENPTASVSIISVRAELEKAQDLNEKILTENEQLNQQLQDTKNQLEQALALSVSTSSELSNLKEISGSAIQTHQQVQTLAKEIQLLQTENDVLIAEKEHLEQNERTTFFIYGMLAVLLGVLIAVIVPKLRIRKRNSGWAD